jgi:hypothetical protein
MAPLMHGEGITTKQAQALNKGLNDYLAAGQAAEAERVAQSIAADEVALKSEWGSAYDARKQMAKAGAIHFGLTAEKLDKIMSAVGLADTYRLFANIGEGMGEDEVVEGNAPASMQGMTPEGATAKLKLLQSDHAKGGWVERYVNNGPDSAERAEFKRLTMIKLSGTPPDLNKMP